MILYRNAKPPEYNLSRIQTKVHIMYGQNDYLVKAEVWSNLKCLKSLLLFIDKIWFLMFILHVIYWHNWFYYVLFQNIPFLIDKIKGSVVAVNKMNLLNHIDFTVGRLVLSVNTVILQVINKIEWIFRCSKMESNGEK